MGGARIRFGEGEGTSYGFIDGAGVKPCDVCGFVADYLCDYPMGGGKTCEAKLCERHAIGQGRRPEARPMLAFMDDGEIPGEETIHFCPTHHLMAGAKKA